MELELNRSELRGYDTVVDTTLFSEETLESIVPDACPDILRILETDGVVCVKSREASEGRAEVRGVIRTTVLYLPEENQGICRMEVAIPCTCGIDHGGIGPDNVVQAAPRILSADARAINPRKVYIRVELAMGVKVFEPCVREIVSGCESVQEMGVQEKREIWQIYMPTAVEEKHFTFSDDIPLPGSKPDMTELLRQRMDFFCAESKVIGNKLIFKGQVMLTLLYKGSDDMPITASFELPFSQIMEVPGAAEEADCELSILLNDFSCQLASEDSRTLCVSMDLSAQAVLREERSLEVVTDLYSTDYELEAQMKKESFCRLGEHGTRRQTVREVVETPVAVKSVVDCAVTVGQVSQQREGDKLMLSADVRAAILFRGEDEELYAITRPVPASQQWEMASNCRCICRCQCPGELYATPTMGGVEVRFPLDFDCRTELPQERSAVCEARLAEEQPRDKAQRPSIILRMVEDGERLWDIAKAYATTEDDIMNANELNDACLPVGKLLLIPKKR